MPFNCPNCSHEIPDVVPKARFDEKVEAARKADERAKAAEKNAALYEAMAPEVETLRSKVAELPTLQERLATLEKERTEAVYSAHGVTNPKVQRVFQLEFDEQASAENGEKDLGKWLTSLKTAAPEARPVHLAPWLGAPAAAPAAAAPATPATPANPAAPRASVLPPASVAAPANPTPARLSPQQFAAEMAAITSAPLPTDATARAAEVAARKAKMAALHASVTTPATT